MSHPIGCMCKECNEYSHPEQYEPNWKGKNLNYDATLTHFAHQLDIPLWKAMAMMKYAEKKVWTSLLKRYWR